jgi:hypothetical protein
MMSAALLKQETDRVRDASEIVKFVSEYVHLRKVGSTGRFIGLCPFHQEKTPSFNVNQSRQFYKCFGCGAAGDVFKFVMEIEGLSFTRAKELLAGRAGVPLITVCGTPAERRRYARVAPGVDPLAVRLADFNNGLLLATERRLSELSVALVDAGIFEPESLSDLHRQVHLLRIATPHDIASKYRAMSQKNLELVRSLERLGREHCEDAKRITEVIVDLLAASKSAEAT